MHATQSGDADFRLFLVTYNVVTAWVLVLTLALAVMVWVAHQFAAPLGIDRTALENFADTARDDIKNPPVGN